MINNIIFDLGNVILKESPNIILNSLKLRKNEIEEIDNQFFKAWEELDLGYETIKQHFDKCKFSFNLDENIKEKLIHYYKYRPFNVEIIDLIKKLKEKNYGVYTLSNNNIDTKEYLLELPLFKRIDGFVFSCDYKILKPDSKIYNILFKKYELIPNECFFIDDIEQNIKAGEFLGMKGFVFNYEKNGVVDLLKELHKFNILV